MFLKRLVVSLGPRTQKQPQVKKEPSRVLDDVDTRFSTLSSLLKEKPLSTEAWKCKRTRRSYTTLKSLWYASQFMWALNNSSNLSTLMPKLENLSELKAGMLNDGITVTLFDPFESRKLGNNLHMLAVFSISSHFTKIQCTQISCQRVWKRGFSSFVRKVLHCSLKFQNLLLTCSIEVF